MSKKNTNPLDISEDINTEESSSTPSDEKPTFSNGWVIFGIFLLVIFVLVAGTIMFQKMNEAKQEQEQDFDYLYQRTLDGFETENNFMYNDFAFVNMSGLWQTILIQRTVYENYTEQRDVFLTTHYSPLELENIPINSSSLVALKNASTVYMTYPIKLDQDYVLAGVEVGKVLGTKNGILNKPVIQAIHGENYTGTYPKIDCVNATSKNVVIKYFVGNKTAVSYDSNCLLIEGKTPADVVRSADRLVFTILGVMKP